MARPLVSILVPAFNAEPWLRDALRSAIAQTWEPKEIIVVDDGSTDGTLEIARQFESEQLRVVANEHWGAAATRNEALALSKGDYIQYLDADDVLAPDKIEKQMKALGESPENLCIAIIGRASYQQHCGAT
jgi:glycosyltransferase involved in cell wall biosynthesis